MRTRVLERSGRRRMPCTVISGRPPRASLVPELPAVLRLLAELLFDAEQLVVLGDAVAAGRGAGLDLATVGGYRDVGDRRVLGLAAAVAQDRRIAVADRQVHRGEGLAERAD